MTLRWPEFERAVGARVRHHDLRRAMGFWPRLEHRLNAGPDLPWWVGRSLATVLLFFFVGQFARVERVAALPGFWGAVAAGWALAVGLGSAAILAGPPARTVRPASASSDEVFWMLPLSADHVFCRFRNRLGWEGAWLAGELFVLLLIRQVASPGIVLAALLCAALQASMALAVALGWTACSRRPEPALGLYAGFVMVLILWGTLVGTSRSALLAHALLNPMGWPALALFDGGTAGSPETRWALLPALVLIGTVSGSLPRVRRRHHRRELRVVPRGRRADGPPPATALLSRAGWLREPEAGSIWDRGGFVEGWLARFLTPRERIVADLLGPVWGGWSRPFGAMLIYLGLLLGTGWLIEPSTMEDLLTALVLRPQEMAVPATAWLAGLVFMAMMGFHGLRLFFQLGWPEPAVILQAGVAGGYRSLRLFPAGLDEGARIVLKIQTVLALLALPPVLLATQATAYRLLWTALPAGVWVAPKALLIPWCAGVLAIALRLTPSLTEGWRYWRSGLMKLVLGAALYGLTAGWLVAPAPALATACGAGLVLVTLGWFEWSMRRYRRAGG